MTAKPRFSDISFIKVRLLREAIYREDREAWVTLRNHQDHLQQYFHDLGQELIIDEAEGYGLLRQMQSEGDEKVPRLSRTKPVGYFPTLLLACLRAEFLQFDATPDASTLLVKNQEELRNLIINFAPETTNQVRDTKRLDLAIAKLAELKYLRDLKSGDTPTYEVMRIVKARIGLDELQEILDRMRSHAVTDV